MLTSTIYDVRIRYSVDGRPATAVRGLTADVRQLGRETGRVSSLMQRLSTAVAGYFGARAAGRALIGFNATVEDTKQLIAGMLALTKKTDLVDQLGAADRLFTNLQRRARELPGTTAEYAQMLAAITAPVTDAGLGLRDLEDMTVNAVVAAKALREQWDVAARDIDQALRGQFKSTDPFAGKILGSMGFRGEEGRKKFNEMSAQQRAETLRNALMQKQIVQLAAAQGQTFSGLLSQLEDVLAQFFGKVGLPLFKILSAELKQWNAWFDANQDKVDMFAAKFADGLVTGFRAVKDAVSFLIEHADTLLTIGKVWAAVKIGGMLGGLGAGGASSLSEQLASLFGAGGFFRGASDRFNPETGAYEFTPAGRGRRAVGGFKGVVGNLGLLGQTLGAGVAIGTLVNEATGLSSALSGAVEVNGRLLDVTDRTTAQFIQLQRSMDALDAATRRAAQGQEGIAATRVVTNMRRQADFLAQQANVIRDALRAREAGDLGVLLEKLKAAEALGLGRDEISAKRAADLESQAAAMRGRADFFRSQGTSTFELAFSQLTDYQKRTLDVQRAQQELLSLIVRRGGDFNMLEAVELLRSFTDDPAGKHKPEMAKKPNVNITIQRIEVQSDDPDRYAFGLVEAFRDAVKNPSAAVRAIREG